MKPIALVYNADNPRARQEWRRLKRWLQNRKVKSKGLLGDGPEGRRRQCWGLVFTAGYSRHQFCWMSFRQTLPEVIEGFEQAWRLFGGVFTVVIPDSLKALRLEAGADARRVNAPLLG